MSLSLSGPSGTQGLFRKARTWLGGLERLLCAPLSLCHSACSGGLTRVWSQAMTSSFFSVAGD
ncbi:rCG59363 [Rattus norvegicus]|uniref:RCG59363 n=1 Tax=Rattus norvegicus TaxID=10116 RepID=A6HSX7_RAT|nr:rCG59363 [Rattus norvegicus]